MNPNTNDEKKASSNPAQERARILAEFRATFTSESGRICLGILKQSAGYGKPAFVPAADGGPSDPYYAMWRDGRKSIIDEIQAYLDTPEDAKASEPKSIR